MGAVDINPSHIQPINPFLFFSLLSMNTLGLTCKGQKDLKESLRRKWVLVLLERVVNGGQCTQHYIMIMLGEGKAEAENH